MRRVYALTLGLLLLTVRAERNFQGYHTEQTNGTTVTKDLLLKKENTIGHGTEAPPRENTYRHAAVAVTAKIPEVVSDTRPPPRLERIQMTKAMTVIASSHKERFAFRNRQKLTSQKGNSTATRIYTESDMPLISNYEKIVLPSTQAAFESMMNNTSEPEVNLSTDAVKSSLWLHTLHVNRSQRSSESIPLTSADRGLGLPVLSASHPHVIDNLAALLHDNADKRAQGKNEKEISTLKRNKSPSGTMQSIIQKPGLSPTVSSNSLSEAPALDFQSSHANPGETSATQGPASTNPALHRSSKLLFPVRYQLKKMEREKFEKKESTVPPHLKTHPSLSTNFKNTFILHQPLDVSSGSENNTPVITEAALSTQKSVFQEGGDHNAASHPTARIRLIEAHRTVVPFSFGKRTTSAVKNPESHSLTERAASLISALRSQTPAKPSSQTKELTLTSLPKDSAIKFTSTSAKTQASPTFTTLNSIVQQSSVYPSGPANKPVMKEPQFPTFTTQKTDVPVTLLSESRQESDDVVSMLTLTPVSSKSSSGRLAMHRFSGTQSKFSSEKTLDVTTPPSFARRNTDLSRESQVVHNLKLGDKSEQVWTAAAEDQDIINTEDRQGEEITDTTERQKSQNDKEELFNLYEVEKGSGEELIINGVEVNQKTERQNMEEHESNTSRENTEGIKEEDAKEDAVRKDTTIINTGNITKDAAANPRECLTEEGAETRREGTARKKDLIHNREIGREDVTNVPPGATTDSEELNRDKGHTVRNSSPCRSLIKRLEATEQKGIYLAENTARNVEMKNTAFSYKVTSNHRQLHSTLRSRMMSLPTEPYTQIKPRPSLHGAMITKPGDASSLATASAQNKVSEDTFSVTAIQKMVPKHTSGVRASKLSAARKPTVSPRSSSTKSAHPALNISDVTSLTTPRLAITAGFLKAQPHVTVNSSTLSLSFIYSISNHSHTLLTSGSKSDSLIQTMDEPGQILESRVKDSLTSNLIHDVNMSTSVNPAAPQQMYSDSLTAGTLSSEAHISIGRLQPHQGQSAGQISQSSSSSSFDMTSGQKCSFQLSAHAAHSHALHPPVDDNRQRSLQTLMATMSPKARNDQLSPSSMSILLNSMLLRADRLPGTYSSTAITRSGSEEETSEDEYANTGSGRAETLLGPSEETNQTEKNDSELTIVSSAVKHSDAAMPSTHEMFSTAFIAQSVGGSRRSADNADDFSSSSMSHAEKRAVENLNENDHNNRFNIDRNNAANKAVKLTLNNNHPSQLEGYNETSTQPIMFAIQTTHKTEQAIREHFLPVTDDSASFGLEPNDGAETEPDYLVPEMPQTNANDVMTDAYFNVGSPAAETSGRHMFPGSVSDNAVPQISPQSDLKVSNTSTQQTAVQTSDATSEFQIIATRNNDFVSPAARINGPVFRESHELELTTSGRTQVVTEKSFQVAHPGKDASAANGENAAERQSVDAAMHPVTVHRFTGGTAPNTKPQNGKYVGPGEGTPPVPSASEYDRATTDELTRNDAKKTTTKTLRAFVDMGHLQRRATRDRDHTAKKTAQPDVTATHTAINSTEWPLVPETNAKTQLTAGAAEGDSAQSAMRSVNAAAEGVMPGQEPGRRLLLLEPGSDPELPAWKHRRRTPPHLYLSGVTEVSEDLCGSGNYTAEMSLNLGRDVEPGDAVPVLGNLRVVINLKTNNSLINLEVTSCCLSPTVQPDLTNSTCCLFSRLAAEPVGITLLPSALSTSASFTISLFQMINYSVVYLHCDLSVCPRNRSDCERECPEQRSTFPADGPDAVVANLRNRISFGPMLKEVKNSTFLEEIEPSELDLALVIVSLVVGSSLVTVMLLLVWLAYRRRAVWLLHSAAPPPACCGCVRPGGDLILP